MHFYPRSVQLSTTGCSMKERVEKKSVKADRSTTLRTIVDELFVSSSTTHVILTDILGMPKVSAFLEPRLLTDTENWSRVCCSRCF